MRGYKTGFGPAKEVTPFVIDAGIDGIGVATWFGLPGLTFWSSMTTV
jgi:hypothetical protein